MERITVTIAPERTRTRLLMTQGSDELMRAVLAAPTQTHPRAATTLLEGLSLWCQRPLHVVLCVGETSDACSLELCDALGYGDTTAHYEVAIAFRGRRRRGIRLGGLGDFRELRQLSLEEGSR